jgi:hypothetical protein
MLQMTPSADPPAIILAPPTTTNAGRNLPISAPKQTGARFRGTC